MESQIPPSKEALTDAYRLSNEILRDIELNKIPISDAALKTSRLARILNDFTHEKIFRYEASGYPSTSNGVPPDVFQLGVLAGRLIKDDEKECITITSLSVMEINIETLKIQLQVAQDPDVSIQSANPQQYVSAGLGNKGERQKIQLEIFKSADKLAKQKSFIHQYVLQKNLELKFSDISSDIFSRIRGKVDAQIGTHVPDAIQEFSAIYENLRSQNPTDWANAAHGCRRILQALADAVFPPQDEERKVEAGKNSKLIKLGKEQYLNRLICFVDDHSTSKRFEEVTGSNLKFLIDRLESIYSAACKGSHAAVSHEEADRYVIYTYMIIGDILTLINQEAVSETVDSP